jgi:oxygen-independent coproporphyrinogen III oxidase
MNRPVKFVLMAGIYIHIPFCKQACYYCDFHFSTSLAQKDDMIKAICQEIEMRGPEFFGHSFDSIYFGGGTPSILEETDLNKIMEAIYKTYTINTGAEVTLESNPDDHSSDNLLAWQKLGINRLSVGIQSFNADNLITMNRAHNAQQAEGCVKQAQDAGFNNLTIDLIYGMATSSHETLQMDMQKAIELQVPHISAYCLTIEPNTAFGKWTTEGRAILSEEEHATTQMTMVFNFLPDNGWLQYEISNFAKLGFESRHNSAYWEGLPYLGIGPSAHSYDGKLLRKWNIKNNVKYIRKMLEDGTVPFQHENLTQQQRANELLLTKLRTKDGLPWNDLFKLGYDLVTIHGRRIMFLQKQGMVLATPSHLYITTTGRFMADAIVSQLMV